MTNCCGKSVQILVCIRQVAAWDRRFSCNLQLHVLARVSTPKSPLPLGVRKPQLTQCLTGRHKCSCQAVSESIKQFQQEAQIRQTDDIPHYGEMRRNRWNCLRRLITEIEIVIATTMSMVLSLSWHSHCESSPSSSDDDSTSTRRPLTSGFKKTVFLKPNPVGFLGFIGFFGQAGKIGKII